MSTAATAPIQIVPSPLELVLLGETDAAACVGDICEIPDRHIQAVVNRKLDEDAV
jgi:hypothetical protein